MGEVVNLRRARKDKDRREREASAASNRRLFGRTKAQKAADLTTRERERSAVDGKRLEKDEN